jgi:hypothetical protein
MIYLIVGIVGLLVMAFIISKWFDDRAGAATRIQPDKPFVGAVPGWVSLIVLGFFCAMLYGLFKVMF